ncbi:MAG: T9SS type A sorting domain-containing protein [Bacteroidota bacterium]|nr:T9SS type A sorting domain-containing protein [Bacteroidota bacterium]
MKKLITIHCLLFSMLSSAQIVYTRADFGSHGDKIIYAVDSPIFSTINFGSTGPNHNWNFLTNQSPKRYDSTLFFSVTSDPNAPGVTANLLLRSVVGGDQYAEVTDSFVKAIVDMPANHVVGVKLKMFNFPLTYQSFSIDSTTATAKGLLAEFGLPPITGIDSVRIDARIFNVSLCDGWGLLTLPDSSTYNSLRVQNNTVIQANIFLHTIFGWGLVGNRIQTNASYSWYAPGSKNYIANVGLDSLGNISSFTYKINSVPKYYYSKIVSVSPDSAMQGESLVLTIKGKNTYFTQGIQWLYLTSTTIDSFKIINDSTILAYIKLSLSVTPGWKAIQIQDIFNRSLYLFNAFKVIASPYAPKLVSVSPGYGANGQTIDVVIKGSRTHFTKGSTINFNPQTASPGGIYVNTFMVINDSVLNCKITIDSITKFTAFNIRVFNSIDGSLSLDNSFSVVPTGINEISLSFQNVLLCPNPNQGNFSVQSIISILSYEVYDISGKLLFKNETDSNKNKIDLDFKLEMGCYYIRLNAENNSVIKKFVINN